MAANKTDWQPDRILAKHTLQPNAAGSALRLTGCRFANYLAHCYSDYLAHHRS
jgi:hypothetical protein